MSARARRAAVARRLLGRGVRRCCCCRCSLGVTVLRFTRGLGATTNLSDRFPWGLWIGFDVLCGVGLAAGAFTLTAIVHLFNLRRFEPIVRPTVLTGFLGYLFVIVGADVRPRPAVAHLARAGLLEPALGDVRGGVVRDALHHACWRSSSSPVVFERLRLDAAAAVSCIVNTPLVIVGRDPLDAAPVVARLALPDRARRSSTRSGTRRCCRCSSTSPRSAPGSAW